MGSAASRKPKTEPAASTGTAAACRTRSATPSVPTAPPSASAGRTHRASTSAMPLEVRLSVHAITWPLVSSAASRPLGRCRWRNSSNESRMVAASVSATRALSSGNDPKHLRRRLQPAQPIAFLGGHEVAPSAKVVEQPPVHVPVGLQADEREHCHGQHGRQCARDEQDPIAQWKPSHSFVVYPRGVALGAGEIASTSRPPDARSRLSRVCDAPVCFCAAWRWSSSARVDARRRSPDWPAHGGDPGHTQSSALAQITTGQRLAPPGGLDLPQRRRAARGTVADSVQPDRRSRRAVRHLAAAQGLRARRGHRRATLDLRSVCRPGNRHPTRSASTEASCSGKAARTSASWWRPDSVCMRLTPGLESRCRRSARTAARA